MKDSKSNLIRFILIPLICLFFSTTAWSQGVNTDYVNTYFKKLSKNNEFNGQVLIAYKGQLVFLKSYGVANLETRLKFNDSTRFQIASLSKQFTATAILLLQEDGLLSIDSSFSFYYPDFPFREITLRHLLNHTSGLPNFVNQMIPDLDTTKVNGNYEMFQMLISQKYPLQWIPGEKWEYCDISFCLLGSLIEKLSGMSYKEFLLKRIFVPAGMTHTSAEMTTDIDSIHLSNMAMGYVYDHTNHIAIPANKLPSNHYVFWLGGFYGDGSVVSTIIDLHKWDQALYKGYPLSHKSQQIMFAPASLNSGEPAIGWGSVYALGWYLTSSPNIKGTILEHPGGHPGFNSRMTRCIDEKLTIIILANYSIDRFWEKKIIDNVLLKD